MRQIATKVPVRFANALLAGMMLWIVTGCGSIGPTTVNRDRFDYITAISESWKQQMLLNIVKLRYADVPVFMDVGQVISGYELEGTLTAGGGLLLGDKGAQGNLGDFLNFGAGGRYLDRPTVTYAPLTGADFVRTMMTPFPPGAIMFLVEAGWPVEILLQISVQSINGLRNQRGGPYAHPPDPEFVEVVRLLSRIQAAGGVGFRVRREKESEEATMMMFHTRRLTPETAKDVAEVRRLLRLDPQATDIQITYGADALSDKEIALHTRSGYQVLIELASFVTVPPQHVAEHRTLGSPAAMQEGVPALPPFVSIQNQTERPADAFARVKYRDHWYWVDDRDFRSKRVFTFLTVLFTLSETGQKIQQPILTIRAN
ncbi:MAG TPA: hypothetical protein VF819_05970 [Nitrospira sp.]